MKNEDHVATQLTVKVDVMVYKAALRARLDQLREEQNKHEVECKRVFEAWKLALCDWCAVSAPGVIRALTIKTFGNVRRPWNDKDSEQIDGDKFLAGAPRLKLPYSDVKCLIERIESLLTQLTMTNQKTVSVSTKAIEGLGLAAEILH
jgi:hypothetical protein